MTPPPPPARFARAPSTRNGCAQAAAATLLAARGRHVPVAELYRRHPPDTPGGLLGTSPTRLEAMLRAHGLAPERHHTRDPRAARAWLERRLDAGAHVALLLDLRHLGRRLPTGHYVVAYARDASGVHVTNLVGTPRRKAPRASLPWPVLLRAWACRAMPLPRWRHAAVAVPQPSANLPAEGNDYPC